MISFASPRGDYERAMAAGIADHVWGTQELLA